LFYPVGVNLYNNVTYLYPDANIWVIGHSLGGALASLVGVTFGAPVVAFEAPGEKLAATRLHLNLPVCQVCLRPRQCAHFITRSLSRLLSTSHTFTTPQIRSPWAYAPASARRAPWEATLWRVDVI
jgi:alpha-beta hydrolase superfamily lysophospholipase